MMLWRVCLRVAERGREAQASKSGTKLDWTYAGRAAPARAGSLQGHPCPMHTSHVRRHGGRDRAVPRWHFVNGEQGQQPQGERGAWAGDRETGHLEEIASASYVEVAKTLGEGRGA